MHSETYAMHLDLQDIKICIQRHLGILRHVGIQRNIPLGIHSFKEVSAPVIFVTNTVIVACVVGEYGIR